MMPLGEILAAAWSAEAATAAALGAATAPAVAAQPGAGQILLAMAIMALGAVLLLAEFFLISAGLLAIGAAACAITSVVMAWQVSSAAGMLMLLAAPVIGVAVVSFGMSRLRRTAAVVQSAITAEAGQRSPAAAAGAIVGAAGVLVTDAYPTGRARFSAGEIDVQVRGGSLAKGTPIAVAAIDGPIILVVAAPQPPTDTSGI